MDPESKWITIHFAELVKKYGGQYIAVANQKVVTSSDNPAKAEAKALKQYPKSKPSILLVPTKEDLVCAL